MKNTRKAKEALLSKLQGKNGLTRSFCIFPYSQKLVDNLQEDMNPFVRPYETEGGQFLIALDVCLSHAKRACDGAGIEGYVVVEPSYDSIKANYITRQLTPLNGPEGQYKWLRVDYSEEVFHNSIDSKSIHVKGMMFDLTIPLSVYLDCVKDIDDFIEIRKKTFEYDLEVLKNDFLHYNTDPAWGMSWYYGKGRLIGKYKTQYWKDREEKETKN